MGERPHIVLLGGGFVAIGAMKSLLPAIKRGEIDVTVVDRENYKCYHGVVAEFLVGRMGPSNLLNPIRRMFRGAQIRFAEVEHIDLAARSIVLEQNYSGVQERIGFDHIVLGLGSIDNVGIYPGLVEHGFKLKTYDDSFRLRSHIVKMFEVAETERDPVERRRLLTFFIAGGGFAGTEVAGELAEYATKLCRKDYPGIRRDEVRVVLVHPGRTILPELYGEEERPRHPKLVEYATRHVQASGVEVFTQMSVAAASPREVTLSTGERIPTRTIISAVGTLGPPLFTELDVPKDRRGRVLTDRTLRVGDLQNVWAGGDCAVVPRPSGGSCPPQALYAKAHGSVIGHNILATLRGEPLKTYTWESPGVGVPLGRGKAVAELRGRPLKGTLAWILLKLVVVNHIPTWDRRLRLVADWVATAIVGRDVVENSVADADDYDLENHLYQPGEVITHEGRRDPYVHVLMEGEVELLSTDNGTEHVVATLTPGARFGQMWRDTRTTESARAKGLVRTVTLRADQTRQIQRLMERLQTFTATGSQPEPALSDREAS